MPLARRPAFLSVPLVTQNTLLYFFRFISDWRGIFGLLTAENNRQRLSVIKKLNINQWKVAGMAAIWLVFTLLLEQFTNIDILFSDMIYDFSAKQWLIPYSLHQKLNPIFYDGAKHFVAFCGTLCVLYMIYSFFKPQYRCRFSAALTVLLCTIIIPTSVGQLKKISNFYCPNQLEHYDHRYPYAKVFESYPSDFSPEHRGRCFPGGHATGAYALMSLCFFFRRRKNQLIAVSSAFFLAAVNGSYQLLRGEHFISHNLVSFFIAVMMIVIIHFVLKKAVSRLPGKFGFA